MLPRRAFASIGSDGYRAAQHHRRSDEAGEWAVWTTDCAGSEGETVIDAPDSDEEQEQALGEGRVVALVPQRLTTHEQLDIRDFLANPFVERAAGVAAEWQTTSQRAAMWEMGGTLHGVQRDRMTEIARLISGAGEQLALARAAAIECELWRLQRQAQGEDKDGDEMCHRSLAELLMYYCISTGHAVANLTGRLLALDGRLHEWLLDQLETNLPPHSNDRRDWLSCDQVTTMKLRKVARRAATPEQQQIPGALTELIRSDAWRNLTERRAIDFHRSRPQSHGVIGVPQGSLWEYQEGGAWKLSGGIMSYDDGLHLAAITTSFGNDALAALVVAMSQLFDDGVQLINQINRGKIIRRTKAQDAERNLRMSRRK